MKLRRAMFIAACLLPIAAGPAAAQAPWPQQSAAPAAPWPEQPGGSPAPWPQQPARPLQSPQQMSPWAPQQQQEPPCVQDFGKLRDDAQKKAQAIQQASKRKATPVEACRLFNAFFAAEAKMIKYARDNQTNCRIPQEIITNLNQGHVRTADIRTKVCQAAAQPQRPAGPSLSDALTAPVPSSSNIKTGRGTFDTLTGSPLGSK
jgi:hypothetical protein